jgi:hypothetical protein
MDAEDDEMLALSDTVDGGEAEPKPDPAPDAPGDDLLPDDVPAEGPPP